MEKNRKIPVTILTGFLGTGKTTAILHLLKKKRPQEQWAVIINEFGKVSVDFETLSPRVSSNEKVFEISGGCICCSAKENFSENLNEILGQQRFDRILIEPSGLGGADMVSEIIKDKEQLEIMPVICMVALDYTEIKKLQINPIYRNQILNSDILVLSKCDLESNETIVDGKLDKLKTDYPGKLQYSKSYKGVLEENLIRIQKWDKKNESQFEQFFFTDTDLKDSRYKSEIYTFDHETGIDINMVIEVLKKHESVVRAKGYIKGIDGWYLLNYTMGNHGIESCNGKAESKLLVISEKDDKGQIAFFMASPKLS